MKRLVVGSSSFFVAILLITKFLENKTWVQSFFLAGFETAVIFLAIKYFLKWWNKKSEDQKSKSAN